MQFGPDMWDERFQAAEYVYGTEPNEFLRAHAPAIRLGRVLCLADGEGRNGVFLASRGYRVTSMDWSAAGQRKAMELAAQRGVHLNLVQADLTKVDLGEGAWDGIVSIFCHLASAQRKDLHQRVVRALAPGGVFLLEAYTPRQLTFGTGGPKDPDMLMDAATIRGELAGLDIIHCHEIVREVVEGHLHTGQASVLQVAGRK